MDIFRILGLDNGEAHIIRNAGGVVTDDVIRSLCLSQRLLGTREILLLHHTDCGLEKVIEDDFRLSWRRSRSQALVGTRVLCRPLGRHPSVDPTRELRRLDDTLIAIVTLGARRPFLLRAKIGGRSFDVAPGSRNLLVMGGATQLGFTHAVPKVARCGPRISLAWRWHRSPAHTGSKPGR